MEGMLNMSQHLSYSNLPMSKRSDWLECSAGMGKRSDCLSNHVLEKTWPNLHSHEIGVALETFMKGKQGRESEKKGNKDRDGDRKAVCTLWVCISSDHFMTYNAVLNDSSLRWEDFWQPALLYISTSTEEDLPE